MRLSLRHIIAALAALLIAVGASAADIIERADSAYNKAEYEKAVELYTLAIDSVGRSSDLYYNLGNAWYRTGHPGRAIVAYERALRLNPRNAEARANLDFVNSKITDRPGERGTLVAQFIRAIVMMATPNAWAWIAFALFALTLGAIALYCFTSAIILRKIGFFGGIALLLITGLTVFIAVKAASRAKANDVAIVTKQSTILSTVPGAPRNRAEEAMLLHEGTKVHILDSINSGTETEPHWWLDVEVDNTHRAWIDAHDIERL